MANKKLVITETRLNHMAMWWKDYAESKGEKITPQERSNWYNIESVGAIDPTVVGTVEVPEGTVFKGNWSTQITGDGLSYQIMVEYDEAYPVKFYDEEHPSCIERKKYCEDNVIEITSEVVDA